MNAAHTIESAVFEITLDPALLPWPDLATDIEAQLLPVVERVFDATEGGFTLDTLEIDLSINRFNGSWYGLRDRLSDALRNALKRHRPQVAAPTGPVTASDADLARNAPRQAPEETALAAETADRAFAAYERLRARLQGYDGSDGDLMAVLGQLSRPSGRVLLQRLVLELRAGILPAAGLVERLDKAEMRALVAALASVAAGDGADRSTDAKTETWPQPQHEPEPRSTLIARLAGLVGLPEVIPTRPAPDLAASGLAEVASPSRWTGPTNGISEAADVLTSIRQALACGDTAAAAALAAKALPTAAIDAEVFAAALGIGGLRALVQGLLERQPQGHAGEAPKAAIERHGHGPDEALFLARAAFELARRTNLDSEAAAAPPMSTRPAGGDPEPSHGDAPASGLIAVLRDGRLDPATLARRCEAPELRRRSAELLARATVEAPGPGVANGSSLLAETIERRRRAVADERAFLAAVALNPARGDEVDRGRAARIAPPGSDRNAAPALQPAVSDGRASEWADPERLIEALRAGSVRPAVLATRLDQAALADLVARLLGGRLRRKATGSTALLHEAIDRHRAAALDQRAFLAGVAVALGQGVDLDLEALCQTTASPGMPPSAEASGETVPPPSAAGSAAWRSTSAPGTDPAAPDETTHVAGSLPTGGRALEQQWTTSEGSKAAPGETVPPPIASVPAARLGASTRGIDPAAAPRIADLPAAPDDAIHGGRPRSAGDRGQGDMFTATDGRRRFAAAPPGSAPSAADGHLAGPDLEDTHAPPRHWAMPAAPPPAAAIEATERERLALMLAEGALAPAALAVLLDAPALAAVVDHLLAATEAVAPGADSATFRTAIERHRQAAADERLYLAALAEALVGGRPIDLEAIAAAATGVPHDDAPDTDAPETDALGPPAAQHDRPGAAGAAPGPQAFVLFLKEGAAEPRALLIDAVESSMAQSPAQFARLVRTALRRTSAYARHESVVREHGAGGEDGRVSAAFVDEKAILRLVGLLPERLLRRAALLLRPETAPLLLKLFDLIGNALLTDGFARERWAMMARCWPALFRYLLVYGEETDLRRFVANLTATMASDPALVRRALAAAMAADPLPTEAAAQRQVALALLELAGDTADPVADGIAASIAAVIAQPDVVLVAEDSAGIDNAGLVLAAPFMPRLFTLLDLLDRGAFKTPEAALHATRVLQYLVDGGAEVGRRPLSLNRILCGVDAAQPEVEARPLGAFEMETVDSLVAKMIERWRSIGNTSSAGLREAFLQRPGRLRRRQEEWHLRVEPRAYDMLLDQLPWSFSIIKHPWMRSPIHVAWR